MSIPLKTLVVFGTRPEAIKLAPVLHACERSPETICPIVCSTGQHRELLRPVIDYFGIRVDVGLDVMATGQGLAKLTSRLIEAVDDVVERTVPDAIVAQGDTTSVMAASLVAFYRRVPFVHVEAGLRTGDLYAPWPEELNRRIATLAAAVHCAPTKQSAANLIAEGVSSAHVHITGNTVVDALLWTVERERANSDAWRQEFAFLEDRPLVLITGHRRENFGAAFEEICRAIVQLAEQFPAVHFVYPVHMNPHVREPVYRILGNRTNIHLVPPASYPQFVWLMDRSTLILSDSGGVQEEAPSLRKPVLVMRDVTERPEAVEAGAVQLVGTSAARIVAAVQTLLLDPEKYADCQASANPYGDGKAAERIVKLLVQQAWNAPPVRRAA